MKKIIFVGVFLAMLLCFLLPLNIANAEIAIGEEKVVTAVELKVYRTYSNLSFGEVVDILPYGEVVDVQEVREAAIKVSTEEGTVGWVSRAYLADSVTDHAWMMKEYRNVRSVPTTSVKSEGIISAYEMVHVLEHRTTPGVASSEWYKVRTVDGRLEGWIWGAISHKQEVIKDDNDNPVKTIANPGYNLIKYENDKREGVTNEVTLFTPLNSVANITAEEINRYIDSKTSDSKSVMKNSGEWYLEAQNRTGLNAIYLMAHSGLETNWGTSNIAKQKFNYFGIGAVDGNPYGGAAQFLSPRDGIIRGAEWIKLNYGIKEWENYYPYTGETEVYGNFFQPTIDNMLNDNSGHQYASDEAWAVKIAYFAKEFYNATFPNGDRLKIGWYEDGTNWYYYTTEGRLHTGWHNDADGKDYYLRDSGIMHVGWMLKNGNWYYFAKSGAKATGWVMDKNKKYFLDQQGKMKTGWEKIGFTWYYFLGSGEMASGWNFIDNKWYFLDQTGAMKKGWLKQGGTWYFLEQSGAMKTGWLKEGSTWYYLEQSGGMKTGWLQLGSTWYHLSTSGAMSVGWKELGGKWYYFYTSGAMAANTVIDGYRLGANGAWIR